MAKFIEIPKPQYILPTARPRLKPRLAPRISIHGIVKPKLAPRIVPTPLSGLKPRSGMLKTSAIKSATSQIRPAQIKTMLTSSSTGHSLGVIRTNPAVGAAKLKSPSQTTGVKSQPTQPTGRPTTSPSTAGFKPPMSMKSMQPGIKPIQGMKFKSPNPVSFKAIKPITNFAHAHLPGMHI